MIQLFDLKLIWFPFYVSKPFHCILLSKMQIFTRTPIKVLTSDSQFLSIAFLLKLIQNELSFLINRYLTLNRLSLLLLNFQVWRFEKICFQVLPLIKSVKILSLFEFPILFLKRIDLFLTAFTLIQIIPFEASQSWFLYQSTKFKDQTPTPLVLNSHH